MFPMSVTRRMIRSPAPSAPQLDPERECSMKLVRFGPRGREKPGIVDAKGGIRDLSKVVPDIAGETLSPKGLAKIRKTPIAKLPLVHGNHRTGPWVGAGGKFLPSARN